MSHNNLYGMNLHDELELWAGFCVIRVPGGWIYKTDNERRNGDWTTSKVFVPLHNEFQQQWAQSEIDEECEK